MGKIDLSKYMTVPSTPAGKISVQFSSLLKQAGAENGFRYTWWESDAKHLSNNIVELFGSVNAPLYYKVSSREPCQWVVSANQIDALNRTGRRWILVLLCARPDRGYVISSEEVNRLLPMWAVTPTSAPTIMIRRSDLSSDGFFRNFDRFVEKLSGY